VEFLKRLVILRNLQVLNLSRNELESIPEEIGNLTNLKILNLKWNELKSIPKGE